MKRFYKRVLHRLDMTLFSVCAILVLDGLSASTSIGPSILFWYLVTLVLFFIPYGMIVAELGTTYPEQGGLYSWIRRAYGARWAARATWCYWVCVPLGIPSAYVLFAGIFSQLFFPSMSRAGIIGLALLLTWITIGIGSVRLDIGRWVPNLGGLSKAVIFLTLGVGGIILAFHHGSANDFSLSRLMPKWNDGLAFLPVVVFNFLGFELVSSAGDEVENPRRNVPAAIMLSGGLITFFYLSATLGILLAMPVKEIGIVQGIVDTLEAIFGQVDSGSMMVKVLGTIALYTFLATMVAWTIGTNRSVAQAADQGNLPPYFSRLYPSHKTPTGAALISGCIATLVLIAYGFLGGDNDRYFWSLFAFASIVFLLPYLLVFPAFLKLRRVDTYASRPYRFPGGNFLAWSGAAFCLLFVTQAIVFFVWVPGVPVDWSFSLPVLIGVIISLSAGEFLIRQ